jgi:hypothetical protein
MLGLSLLAATLCQAEIYRWVDKDGQTHFADQQRGRQPHEIGLRSPSSARPDPQARLEKTRRLLNAIEMERQREREQAAERSEEAARRRDSCFQARDRLRQASESGGVYRLDQQGNRVYLSEAERAAAVAKYRKAVSDWCD